MMSGTVDGMKAPPAYSVTSVDHALRIAAMLQLEESLTVTEVATRLGVARSTAHRLLAMLLYRDFAVQDENRAYRAGPVLALAAHSKSVTSRLRENALPQMLRMVKVLDESANLIIRHGTAARFIASVECDQALRVSSREGMGFPAHRTSGGLLLLAELGDAEVAALYESVSSEERPDQRRLFADLARIRRSGFALNDGRSERGIVAIGVAVRDHDGTAVAALCVSIPSVRYDRVRLPELVGLLHETARRCTPRDV